MGHRWRFIFTKSLPVTNSQQVDTWQWTVSQPASMAVGNVMYATYSD